MKKKKYLFLFLLWMSLVCNPAISVADYSELGFKQEIESCETLLQKSYTRPAHVPQDIWDACSKYFLPEDHPAKPFLDRTFGTSPRVIYSTKTLLKAGFKDPKPGKWSGTIVTRHKKLKGYLIKLFTDKQIGYDDAKKFLTRVEGSLSVKATIEANGWTDTFKVPQKWIYPLPESPAPKRPSARKNFILIAEDMDLINEVKNLTKWKSDLLPRPLLDLVFKLLKAEGLKDSAYVFNLPFAKDGRIAVIDTEYYHIWPVPYKRLCKHLSPNNCNYWMSLIENGGPP